MAPNPTFRIRLTPVIPKHLLQRLKPPGGNDGDTITSQSTTPHRRLKSADEPVGGIECRSPSKKSRSPLRCASEPCEEECYGRLGDM